MDPEANRLLQQISKQHRKEIYKANGREIPEEIWNKLKALRECQNCQSKFNQPPYIHHIKPVKYGGTSTEDNLIAVCWECHEKLDAEAEEKYKKNTIIIGEPIPPKQHLLAEQELLTTINNAKETLEHIQREINNHKEKLYPRYNGKLTTLWNDIQHTIHDIKRIQYILNKRTRKQETKK